MTLSTMDLLDRALEAMPGADWARELNLHRNALYNAKQRGHVSPAIAGALAEKLNENVDRWIVIAALESEKDSACKQRMVNRMSKLTKSHNTAHESPDEKQEGQQGMAQRPCE